MINIWPKQANIPIRAIQDHCIGVGLIQTIGTKKDAIMAPTTPVISNVSNGLSVECNLRVIIR